MKLNNEEIRKILPHRYPFLLIDRVTECEPGVHAEAIKCVSAGEPYFQGHFPDQPVMPGVLIIEALAQTGAVAMLSLPKNKGKLALFGGIKNARFKKMVVPGDILTLRCDIIQTKGSVGTGTAEATVDGAVAAKAELMFVLTEAQGNEQDDKGSL